MFTESALFRLVTPSLTTALCSWSTSTCAQIRKSSLWSECWYRPVTPITTGINSTFDSLHSGFEMFLRSASLVIPISIIF